MEVSRLCKKGLVLGEPRTRGRAYGTVKSPERERMAVVGLPHGALKSPELEGRVNGFEPARAPLEVQMPYNVRAGQWL